MSEADRIVVDQAHQSELLFERVKAAHPKATVEAVVGHWRHSVEMRAKTQLPKALEWLGLLET